MPVLAFRHVAFEHLGRIADALERNGIPFAYADPDDPYIEAAADRATALISMGGPMSANDDLPWLRREMACIERAATAGKPVLGVCLGAQIAARALGARVYRNAVKEIGWAPVYWTGAARRDPLFAPLLEPEVLFHWHGETFDLPPGAEWLAFSDACRHQAFRAGENVYGLQFHLEVTPTMIEDWCRQDANCGDVKELDAPLDPEANARRLDQVGRLVFDRWCALVKAAS